VQIFLEKSLEFSMLASYHWSERDTRFRGKVYLVARIRIFGNEGAPLYYVVAAEF
jgi:hypothetical protein